MELHLSRHCKVGKVFMDSLVQKTRYLMLIDYGAPIEAQNRLRYEDTDLPDLPFPPPKQGLGFHSPRNIGRRKIKNWSAIKIFWIPNALIHQVFACTFRAELMEFYHFCYEKGEDSNFGVHFSSAVLRIPRPLMLTRLGLRGAILDPSNNQRYIKKSLF
jgi:hypothetical protein